MSTNYNILIKSEKNIKKLVVDFMEYVIKVHTKMWKELSNPVDGYASVYDNTERRVKKSSIMEDELLDECIWTISKDDPRANHLKFIISIIYSAKDLARASEYAQSISKIILRNNLSQEKVDLLLPISEIYISTIHSILELYKSKVEDKLEEVDKIISNFEDKLNEQEKEIRNHFDKTNEQQVKYIIVSQILRLISSTIERIKVVIPSTIFIKANTKTITIKSSKK